MATVKTYLAAVGCGVLLLGAVAAHAGESLNGIALNGLALNGITLNSIALNGVAINGLSLNGFRNQGLLLKETRRTEAPTSAVQSESVPCEHDRQCTLAVQSESLPFNSLSQRGLGKTHPQAHAVHMSFVSSYLNIYCALARAASVPILCGLI